LNPWSILWLWRSTTCVMFMSLTCCRPDQQRYVLDDGPNPGFSDALDRWRYSPMPRLIVRCMRIRFPAPCPRYVRSTCDGGAVLRACDCCMMNPFVHLRVSSARRSHSHSTSWPFQFLRIRTSVVRPHRLDDGRAISNRELANQQALSADEKNPRDSSSLLYNRTASGGPRKARASCACMERLLTCHPF
jgi:hypothetical protein